MTPSVAAPGVTHPSDATGGGTKDIWSHPAIFGLTVFFIAIS